MRDFKDFDNGRVDVCSLLCIYVISFNVYQHIICRVPICQFKIVFSYSESCTHYDIVDTSDMRLNIGLHIYMPWSGKRNG